MKQNLQDLSKNTSEITVILVSKATKNISSWEPRSSFTSYVWEWIPVYFIIVEIMQKLRRQYELILSLFLLVERTLINPKI
jgi:hypothetical protein